MYRCSCWFQKSRNMELLEQELNDPNSPQPPPLPPRPAAMPLPGMHSASEAPAGSAVTSRSPSNQSVGDGGSISGHEERVEPRYVSSPVVPRPPKSATSVARQLRVSSGRRHALDRARTCDEGPASDTPPALPPPRKFSLPLESLGASRSPGQQEQEQSPSTPVDGSPRSSPHLPHSKHL